MEGKFALFVCFIWIMQVVAHPGKIRQEVPSGNRQSPIDIMNEQAEAGPDPLKLEYPPSLDELRLNNTGHGWQVNNIGQRAHLWMPTSADRYRLEQFHGHWGADHREGSEHTVDGRRYAGELHFVHFNEQKYDSFGEAALHSDGLLVVAVFLEAKQDSPSEGHPQLQRIIDHLGSIAGDGESFQPISSIDINNLLPANKSYWSYEGSLTTEPYLESVTWFVLQQPIQCSLEQLRSFRSLMNSEGHTIQSNFRAAQPLHGRKVVRYDEPLN